MRMSRLGIGAGVPLGLVHLPDTLDRADAELQGGRRAFRRVLPVAFGRFLHRAAALDHGLKPSKIIWSA